MNTGEKLTKLRTKLNLSQDELAETIGVSQGSIALWENNKRNIPTKHIIKLADTLNVTTDYLLGRSELTFKEKQDIGLEVDKLLEGLSNNANINFYGEPLTPEGKENLKIAIQMAMELNKQKAKQKFTPNKFKM